MSGGGEEESIKLEFTPTWIVAVVCSVIVFISLLVERQLHFLGKLFKKKNQKPLYEALLKVKEELMLLGFISLLLTVFQGLIQKICIPEGWTNHMLPCKKEDEQSEAATTEHLVSGVLRRLLSEEGSATTHCSRKGKVPLLSIEALHQLHIFIFVLALTHVVFSVLTVILGGAKIRQWKHWENSIHKNDMENVPGKVTHVQQFEFIQDRFKGTGKDSRLFSWLYSFGKQFYGSVTKSDYTTMRLGFIMTHCKGNPKFDFHKYMVRALEADFKKVVGISWYLWVFVMVFLLLNVNGWHTYFWIAFAPLVLLLALGAKLEHIITQLAHEVAEKHTAIQGDLVVKPSDEHFWFNRPKIVLYMIHFILFQNAFEIAFFFWILTTYGFNSCIMGQVGFIIPRLIIGAIIQILCSYSTLPLYAIVTQMGSSFKKAIFEEHVQESLVGWAQKVKKRKGFRTAGNDESVRSSVEMSNRPVIESQTSKLLDKEKDSMMEEGRAGPSE
ncbi:MLO-like protein 1 isoform X2 [Asparagus officinalis]|uniref:MLO-like protein 1 isoform X2 n=1 Tax=Asparagus officinalis TaxID=4686 RepID=UPI00098E38C1|nr:MLO-like protein 1 isoform X2 [Asparagus officinalis]